MVETKFKSNGIIFSDDIEEKEDQKPKDKINTNSRPLADRCDCCGRHISELKPFGGPGDPLVGDFTGCYLIKKHRFDRPFDEEAEEAYQQAEKWYRIEGFDHPLPWLVDRYGFEKGKDLYERTSKFCTVSRSIECRDCAVLSLNEYYEKYYKRLMEEEESN